MSTTQILKINCFGKRYTVIFLHDTVRNPFKLYEVTAEPNKYGYPTNHKHLLAAYQNFEGCLYHLAQLRLPEFRRDVF